MALTCGSTPCGVYCVFILIVPTMVAGTIIGPPRGFIAGHQRPPTVPKGVLLHALCAMCSIVGFLTRRNVAGDLGDDQKSPKHQSLQSSGQRSYFRSPPFSEQHNRWPAASEAGDMKLEVQTAFCEYVMKQRHFLLTGCRGALRWAASIVS